jgi:exopolyphosphatase/guanosine-5'-triphosphate,3'-diphosphate pyrophosphatase
MVRNPVDIKDDTKDQTLYAAADLGSNSFHMIITRCTKDRFTVIERARAVVRLADGIEKGNGLQIGTQQRAFEALRHFRGLLNKVPSSNVRVVGTSALRQLSDQASFITAAGDILGLPIEIITGREEARLINLGVAGNMKNPDVARLIVDIGGGSTEIIVAEDTTILADESLSMGCVTFSKRFFPKAKITPRLFKRAQAAAGDLLETVMGSFSGVNWIDVVGTSGTIKTTRKVINYRGQGDKEISMDALDSLIDTVISAGHLDKLLRIRGLTHDRAPVFPGGLAILKSIMERFAIKSMKVSKTAMREGIIFDLLGKRTPESLISG